MVLLVFIVIIFLAIHFHNRSRQDETKQQDIYTESLLDRRNQEWLDYILSYYSVVKTDDEKNLLDKMTKDIKSQGLVPSDDTTKISNKLVNATNGSHTKDTAIANELIKSQESLTIADKPKTTQSIQLDNVTLLLYFGAFLFVSSVGLFVVFANASGWVRTLAVLFVTLAMYSVGHWVYRNKTSLKPAGLAFVGIGIAVAPLVGLAGNAYIVGASSQVLWFMTSIFCLVLYSHALITLRQPLLNYIFIFTLLSLFESGVSIFESPIYYYGWMMSLLGLGLQGISVWRGIWPELRDSSKSGSQLFVPLAVFVSIIMTVDHGFGQLGVSLVLSGIYYGLEAYLSSKQGGQVSRDNVVSNALVSHISLVAGLTSLFYGLSHVSIATGMFVLVLSLLHVLVLLNGRRESVVMQNIVSVMLGASLVSIVLLFDNFMFIAIALLLVVLQGIYAWWNYGRIDAYSLSLVSWATLPIVIAKLAINPGLSINQLIGLSIVFLIAHICFYLFASRQRLRGYHQEIGRMVLLSQILLVAGTVLFASPGIVLLSLFIISLILLVLSMLDKDNVWEITSGVIISLAVMRNWTDVLLVASITLALAYNILLALRFRSESNRWISTVLWLLYPVGLGGLTVSQHWSTGQYAWCYVVVMLGLIISRAFARGVVFLSTRIPLSVYVKNASMSYVFGYIMAGFIAVFVSLMSLDSQLHTTLILGVIGIFVLILAYSVEKLASIVALLPIIIQFALMSSLRPDYASDTFAFFVYMSSIMAIICYLIYKLVASDVYLKKYVTKELAQFTIATSLVAPFSIFYADGLALAMPIGLIVAGMMLYDFWSKEQQILRESAVTVVVLGLLWAMYYFNVSSFQAYSHVLVAMFVGFSWWRHQLKDEANSDNYIYVALATATIPLAIQAMSDTLGGFYGWWLLLEQVTVMLIGMSIRKGFVIKWGLYVSVASVLYQLRGLGYAALAVLAVFVIGIAIYQLQKYNKPD